LSDLAARAFFAGKDARLPKFPTPEGVAVGSQNSLLRRYALAEDGTFPEAISEIAVKATCRLGLAEECASLLADWQRAHPKSPKLTSLMTLFRNNPIDASEFRERNIDAIEELFGGQPSTMILTGPASLARAKAISQLYLDHFHHPVPFDRDVVRVAWEQCSDENCDTARQKIEEQLGRLDAQE
jgi:hypothetical protein